MLKRNKSAHMSPVLVPLPHGTTELCPMCALTRWFDAAITEGPVFRGGAPALPAARSCPPFRLLGRLPEGLRIVATGNLLGRRLETGVLVPHGSVIPAFGRPKPTSMPDRVAPPAPSNPARNARLARADRRNSVPSPAWPRAEFERRRGPASHEPGGTPICGPG